MPHKCSPNTILKTVSRQHKITLRRLAKLEEQLGIGKDSVAPTEELDTGSDPTLVVWFKRLIGISWGHTMGKLSNGH